MKVFNLVWIFSTNPSAARSAAIFLRLQSVVLGSKPRFSILFLGGGVTGIAFSLCSFVSTFPFRLHPLLTLCTSSRLEGAAIYGHTLVLLFVLPGAYNSSKFRAGAEALEAPGMDGARYMNHRTNASQERREVPTGVGEGQLCGPLYTP